LILLFPWFYTISLRSRLYNSESSKGQIIINLLRAAKSLFHFAVEISL